MQSLCIDQTILCRHIPQMQCTAWSVSTRRIDTKTVRAWGFWCFSANRRMIQWANWKLADRWSHFLLLWLVGFVGLRFRVGYIFLHCIADDGQVVWKKNSVGLDWLGLALLCCRICFRFVMLSQQQQQQQVLTCVFWFLFANAHFCTAGPVQPRTKQKQNRRVTFASSSARTVRARRSTAGAWRVSSAWATSVALGRHQTLAVKWQAHAKRTTPAAATATVEPPSARPTRLARAAGGHVVARTWRTN